MHWFGTFEVKKTVSGAPSINYADIKMCILNSKYAFQTYLFRGNVANTGAAKQPIFHHKIK